MDSVLHIQKGYKRYMTKEHAANLLYEDVTRVLKAEFKGATMIQNRKDGSWKVYGRFLIPNLESAREIEKKMLTYGFDTFFPKKGLKNILTFIKSYK